MKKLLLIVTLFLSFILNAQNSVPFTLNEYGHIMIKVKVDNVEGNFIFDTGAGLNVYFEKFAKKLSKKESYNFFVGHRATGEAIECPLYHSESVMIGKNNFKDQTYSTFDVDFPNVDGLISLQMFQNTPVTIDYEKSELIFGELKNTDKKKFIDIQIADHAGKAIDIFTNIKVNNKITIQVSLDSGSGKGAFTFSSHFLDVLGLNKADFKTLEAKSDFNNSKSNKVYMGSVAEISTVNNLAKVEKPNARFVDGLIYEGITGIEWLGKKITISIPDKKIYIIK
ncbi:hypothetical protein M2347_001891 [Chryseobacterium sp. H1D6B]|uniref:aspartyl protease family protein n=1 Tax=Chryseobacterium sp. H1D6B TaxID=2940588 RepID=UPI0015C8283E|nr:aspartyl protease family protein [Chryseobacterium sp. H1D6B]MDH6252164.1 hypothetical protein [Chryseobacterium sp. H1D6B]